MAVRMLHLMPASAGRRREAVAGLLFVLPWLLSLLVFTLYPVIAALYFSFTDYTVVQAPRWIGTANYRAMLDDPAFWISLRNSGYYTLLSVPLGLGFSLGLAMLLNMRATGIGVYRTLFYLPSLVPPIVGTLIFTVMFNPQGGPVNTALRALGLPAPGWFADPAWAKPGLVALSLWGLGAQTLIFLAGLKEIPSSLVDAASIDGANAWQRFRHITLPLLSPVILFNLVMAVIGSFQVFAPALVVGGQNGRPAESTLMYMVHLYRNAFRYFKMGYASALAVVLFIAVLLLTLVIFRSARLWVFYEGERSRNP